MALNKHLGCSFLATTILAVALASNAADTPNAPANRDAKSAIIKMRMKNHTQQLDLTPAQQAQFKAILEQEMNRVAETQSNPNKEERFSHEAAIKKETQGKLRQVLSAEQQAKWDAAQARSKTRKTKAPKANADQAGDKKETGGAPAGTEQKAETAPAVKPAGTPQ